jgi:hypothetical protein
VGFNQFGEVDFKLFTVNLIREAIKICHKTPNRAGIDINGAGGISVQLQCTDVPLVKLVKAFLFMIIHW